MTTKLDVENPTGASILDYEIEAPTRTVSELVEQSELVDSAGHLNNITRILEQASSRLHQTTTDIYNKALLDLHHKMANDLAKNSMEALLKKLSDLGFSWHDIARISGVSVPALRKWRHGKSATGANRKRVAMVVALCDISQKNYHIDEVAGWLETPIHQRAPISGLDLIAKERFDLVLELASTRMQDPELILDRFEPEWREKYSSPVEVFIAPDGLPGLRLTEGGR